MTRATLKSHPVMAAETLGDVELAAPLPNAAGRGPRRARSTARPQRLNLAVVLGEALSAPVARFDERIIECALEVDHDLTVQTEPDAWFLVMAALVANAVQHGFADRKHGGCISVSAGRVGAEQVRVTFTDDGRGFSGDARAAARAHQYGRGSVGTSSQGLDVVRDIVRNRLHGTLSLLDTDEGAMLAIDFPGQPPFGDACPSMQ